MGMNGESRRQKIIAMLGQEKEPVSGETIAKKMGVSRQVIVQDIALLRAENRDILSTNKGYMLFHPQERKNGCTAVIRVKHTAEQTMEEFQSILDYGGRVLNVSVEHDLYGQIEVDLVINDIKDAEDFCRKMARSKSKLLKELTEDCHYHTIQAPSEKALELIKAELRSKGFLMEN